MQTAVGIVEELMARKRYMGATSEKLSLTLQSMIILVKPDGLTVQMWVNQGRSVHLHSGFKGRAMLNECLPVKTVLCVAWSVRLQRAKRASSISHLRCTKDAGTEMYTQLKKNPTSWN